MWPGRSGVLKNLLNVVSGLGCAEGAGVTRHLTPCWTMAAGHTNPLASAAADKTCRNMLKGLYQQARSSGFQESPYL